MNLYSNQEKLKGRLPLAAIDTVETLPEDNTLLQITVSFKHPLILQASSRDECQEWIKAIENGENMSESVKLCQGQSFWKQSSMLVLFIGSPKMLG